MECICLPFSFKKSKPEFYNNKATRKTGPEKEFLSHCYSALCFLVIQTCASQVCLFFDCDNTSWFCFICLFLTIVFPASLFLNLHASCSGQFSQQFLAVVKKLFTFFHSGQWQLMKIPLHPINFTMDLDPCYSVTSF